MTAKLIFLLVLLQTVGRTVFSNPCRGSVEGDIIVDSDARVHFGRRHARAATALKWNLWPNGTIPYVIDNSFNENTARTIHQATKHWEQHTCIRFIKRTTERNYVYISSNGTECCSKVGRTGGRQYIFLGGAGCWIFGIVLHELGHSIGFWHEQSRSDRDEYVEVLSENIENGYHHNFAKKSRARVNSMDQPYDYRSIMHYGVNFYSRNNRRTMRLKLAPHMEKYLAASYSVTGPNRRRQILSSQDIIQTNLLYNCPYSSDKGIIYVSPEGTISSPGYPNPYTITHDFIWIVTTQQSRPQQTLTVLFDDFSVGKQDVYGRCISDYLEIRNGKGPLSPFLAKVCGNSIPDVISVFGDSLFFRLHATERNTDISSKVQWKFSLRYKTYDCSRQLNNPQGFIQSPDYPQTYPAGKDCVWQINAPSGFRIKVQFSEFHLREVDSSRGCLDFFEIREGDLPLSKFTGRYCGRNNPGEMVLPTNKLRLSFHSQEGQSERPIGFRGRYQFIDIDECAEQKTLCEHGCANYPGGFACGCRLGYKYVEKVSNNGERHCVDIDECEQNNGGCSTGCINTEGSYFCGPCPNGYYLDEDKKTCKDSDECKLSLCQQKCANSPGGFQCSCNVGFILGLDKRSCFALPFCTGTITTPVGRFTSPSIPSWYNGVIDCQWTIQVLEKYTIGMYIWLNWSRDERCRNYVEITLDEGRGRYSLQLCGQQDVEGLGLTHFKSHQLTVRYHAEPPYSDGFQISYHMRPKKEEICGGVLRRSSGFVQTPHYPSPYPNKAKCIWKIKSKYGKKVILQFDSFDLESQTSCKYDFIDIQEKNSPSSRIKPVGRFCGDKRPPVITTTANELLITFQSDGTVQKSGFRAKYYAS